MPAIKGICVPICTVFDKSGDRIDEGGIRAHIDRMIEAGVHIILSCGGTGEFAYLTEAERRQVHQVVGQHVGKRAGFMAHASATSTRDAVENVKAAIDCGAQSVMMLPPYFEGPTLEGVLYHYEQVAKAAGKVPIIAYNIPQASNRDLTPEIFLQLTKLGTITHIKDSTGNLVRIQQLLQSGAKVLNGGDPIAFEALLAGSVGCIWGAGNVMPKETVALYDLVTAGKLAEARDLWKRILPAQLFFWSHDYNPSIKAATNLLGGKVGYCRMPLQPLSREDAAELKRALAALKPGMAQAAE